VLQKNTLRQATEREAINMPVQGTAAETLKLAMLGVDRRMTEEGFKSNLLLQVHDELIFETPPDEIENLKALLLDVMPRAMEFAPTPVEFAVPLKVATKTGSN
jgi:DNA polymerase-1